MVEDVEDLRAELEVRRLRNREALVEYQIELLEVWTTQRVARQVAKRSGQRNRERRRIDDAAIVIQVRIDTRNEIWAPHVSRRSAAGSVDHADESDRQGAARKLSGESLRPGRARAADRRRACRRRALHHDVRPRDTNFDRKTTASVDDAADFPVAKKRVANAAEIMIGSLPKTRLLAAPKC